MLYVTDGIVLHHAPYRDNDRMVTLLSPTLGRIEAIARGSRKPNSALLGASELFCAGEFTLNQSRDHHSITQCEVKESFYELRLDYDRLMHGMYCLSLTETAALPGMEASALFMLLLRTLTLYNYSDLPPELITSGFEMRFMAQMGLSPLMDRCVACGRPLDGSARFDAEKGGAVCAFCKSTAPVISNVARRIIMKAARTEIDKIPLLIDHPEWREAARLYRPFIESRIERHILCETPSLPQEL